MCLMEKMCVRYAYFQARDSVVDQEFNVNESTEYTK